jgi:NAD(P)-dependent dehydrogenase (short-subunit alcohol dehydrogenase family)
MPVSLASKVAIVTGAASGLGKAIATAFLKAGASVLACDVNSLLLEKCHSELSSLGSLDILAGDLTDPEVCAGVIRSAVEKYGKLDILVNNAGIMDRFDPIGDIDMALWDRVIATNLTAPARLSKLAIQEFLREGKEGEKQGVILNVGSMNSLRGGAAGAAYTSAKHGLLGLTRNTAAFYATKGVRCNIITPGGMETSIMSGYGRNVHQEGVALTMKVVGTNPSNVNVDELAKLVVFACSDDAKYLNGAIISADHGWQAI